MIQIYNTCIFFSLSIVGDFAYNLEDVSYNPISVIPFNILCVSMKIVIYFSCIQSIILYVLEKDEQRSSHCVKIFTKIMGYINFFWQSCDWLHALAVIGDTNCVVIQDIFIPDKYRHEESEKIWERCYCEN